MGSRRRSSSCEPVLIAVEMSGLPNPLHCLDLKSQNEYYNEHRFNSNEPNSLQPEIMLAADLTKYGNPIDAVTSSLTIRRKQQDAPAKQKYCCSTNDLTSNMESTMCQSLHQLFVGEMKATSISSPSILTTKSMNSKIHKEGEVATVGGKV